MSDLYDLIYPHPDISAMIKNKDFNGLMKALRHRDPEVQFQASAALSSLGSEGMDHLIAGLKSWSKDTRLGIIEALGEIRSPEAVDPLIPLLKDESNEIRWEAALALGEIGDTRAIPPLKEALSDKDRYVRYGASAALEKLMWAPSSHEEYALLLNGKQEWDSLAEMGESAIGPLSISATDLETAVRIKAVKTLGNIGNQKAIPALYRALRDIDGHVRWEAVMAASKSGIPVKFLPRALSRRTRTRKNPYIAGFLNFIIPGIGYFWLGKWWGVIVFQIDILLTAMIYESFKDFGAALDLLLPLYLLFGIHAWYIARSMPDF
ncbi:MAG: HEAT repeat domain-containing protein [Methanoregulaceae archaeon]|nr:HEAT repeat domain-containing protein [Methanoregulaceae archaeon]